MTPLEIRMRGWYPCFGYPYGVCASCGLYVVNGNGHDPKCSQITLGWIEHYAMLEGRPAL